MSILWTSATRSTLSHKHILVLLATLFFTVLVLPVAVGQPTTTTLSVSPINATAGQVVTLTATVSAVDGGPVTFGTVTFSCTGCVARGMQVLGTVQLVQLGQQAGTATLKIRFAPGTYTLTARFNGISYNSYLDSGFQPSQSQPQQLTVAGTEPTITTLTAKPDGSNYDFTASVFGFGFPPPTGTASFNDLTTMLSLGSAAIVGPGMSTFQPQQTYPTGAAPFGVATGDFNGDGFPDIATPNSDGATVSVLLGKGNGTFQPQQAFPAGVQPYAVAAADFNGDGVLDLAVANSGENTVSVLLGKGDGTFQTQKTYGTGSGPFGIAVGDFNGDGIPDLAVANQGGNNVSVLLGKGDGTFQPQQTYDVGNSPFGIAVADFNGDGIADLAVTNARKNPDGTYTVSVLLGKGDGSFQPQQTYGVGNSPFGIAVADFNGDGIPDLAVANQGDNTVGVLLGKGDGTFKPQQAYPAGTGPVGVAVGDFNGDGVPDLAATNGGSNNVSVLLGKGNGTFQPQQTYPAGAGPQGVAVADFNGDGVPD